MFDITNPIFTDANKARAYLEAQRWPDGPVCPHCGARHEATKLKGKSTRAGVYKCKGCEKPYSVTVGTVFERSKIPLNKWVLATFLMCSSKKGMSAHQIHRMLDVTYKTAWFMCHRIRESMNEGPVPGGLGGPNTPVEADETFVGGKAKNVHRGKPEPKKQAVVSLVERGGRARSVHVPNIKAHNLRAAVTKNVSRQSVLMTDENLGYKKLGKEFAAHHSVNHSAGEYVRLGWYVTTNSVESYFALLKRGVMGTFHHISEQHLQRYLVEFDFRFSNRKITDFERTNEALKAIGGKRLTYRGAYQAAHA